MTVLYCDTSALLKRVVVEPESTAVRRRLRELSAQGAVLTSSSLAWVETWRALRRLPGVDVEATAAAALSGIAELPLTDELLTRARRCGPKSLRTLDAIHLASAIAVGTDSVLTYDERLADAARSVGLAIESP